MLHAPGLSSFGFSYDNWGTPGNTMGTAVTPGTSNAEGSWTQVAASANITEDCYWLYMQIFGGSVSAAAKNFLVDVGVDPAGGTSYTAVVSDIDVSESPGLTQNGNREFFFPLYIAAGSSVAVRIQGSHGTATTNRVLVKFYGKPSRPEMVPKGMYSETLGAVGASSRGTTFTPGNAAYGSYTDLGATTKDLWWWQLGYGIDNTVITQEDTLIQLAWGDATNKQEICTLMHVGSTAETCGLGIQTHLAAAVAYQPVPAGTHIYVRGFCQNAPDSGYHATATGFGG